MSEERMKLTVNVAGEPTHVEMEPHKILWLVMNQAFSQTGRTGEPWENWEMRDSDGRLLDKESKISSFDWEPGETLFLNMKAGIGG